MLVPDSLRRAVKLDQPTRRKIRGQIWENREPDPHNPEGGKRKGNRGPQGLGWPGAHDEPEGPDGAEGPDDSFRTAYTCCLPTGTTHTGTVS